MSANTGFQAWHLCEGKWLPVRHVSLADRGFRYGASVFETVYMHGGKPVFWKEHLERFHAARQALGGGASLESGKAAQLLRHAGEFLGDRCGMLRLVATEGEGSVLEAAEEQELYAYAEPLDHVPFPASPVTVKTFAEVYSPVLHGHKTGSYLFHLRARRKAMASGAGESILQSASGQWICASMANIFIVNGDELLTPSCSAGARDGVVRNWVGQHMKVREEEITEAMAWESGGMFLTNSRIGIQEVTEANGRPLALWEGIAGLQKAYGDFIGAI